MARGQKAPGTIDPGAVEQHRQDTEEFYKLRRQIRQGTASAGNPLSNRLAPPPSTPTAAAGPRFQLKKIEFTASSILTAADLDAITRPFINREASLADLNFVVSVLNQVYRNRGYLTASAVLPPQTVTNGLVKIQLVESRLGKIIIQNQQHTRTSYFTRGIGLQSGEVLQVQALERALQHFNETSDLKVKAILQAGEEFGTTDLVIAVSPSPFQSTSATFDDAGVASTGRNTAAVSETINSLLGYRDALTIGGSWSGGMWAGFASYKFPLGARGLRLGPQFSYNQIRIRESALQSLGVNGDSLDVSFSLSQLFTYRRRYSVNLFFAPHFEESTLKSQNFRISSVPVRSLELGGQAQVSDRHGAWSGNLSIFGGDYSAGGLFPFFKFDAGVNRFLSLPHGLTALFRAQGQAMAGAPKGLPPSQQFQIGGIATVRGYPEGALLSNEGYAASAEVDALSPFGTRKLFGIPLNQCFRTAWFVDHGGIESGRHNLYLAGSGGGLLITISQHLQGHAYLATPLAHRSDYDHFALHFGISATPWFPRFRQTEHRMGLPNSP